jgi:hypothetical protein
MYMLKVVSKLSRTAVFIALSCRRTPLPADFETTHVVVCLSLWWQASWWVADAHRCLQAAAAVLIENWLPLAGKIRLTITYHGGEWNTPSSGCTYPFDSRLPCLIAVTVPVPCLQLLCLQDWFRDHVTSPYRRRYWNPASSLLTTHEFGSWPATEKTSWFCIPCLPASQ